jgi:hypothetical protein
MPSRRRPRGLAVWLPLVIVLVAFGGLAYAKNVKFFNKATIRWYKPATVHTEGKPVHGPPTTLPLDDSATFEVPKDAAGFLLTVEGEATDPNVASGAALFDEDGDTDTELAKGHVPKGATFKITFTVRCVKGQVDKSGEAAPEVFVIDGEQRIPVGKFWTIECDP